MGGGVSVWKHQAHVALQAVGRGNSGWGQRGGAMGRVLALQVSSLGSTLWDYIGSPKEFQEGTAGVAQNSHQNTDPGTELTSGGSKAASVWGSRGKESKVF